MYTYFVSFNAIVDGNHHMSNVAINMSEEITSMSQVRSMEKHILDDSEYDYDSAVINNWILLDKT